MASAGVSSDLATAMNESAVMMSFDRLSELKFAYRSLFYLITPNETSFETLSEVPNYHLKVTTVSHCRMTLNATTHSYQ